MSNIIVALFVDFIVVLMSAKKISRHGRMMSVPAVRILFRVKGNQMKGDLQDEMQSQCPAIVFSKKS